MDAPTQPRIIGLYGISGSGKTRLLNQLAGELDATQFSFHEGSETISSLLPGGLDSFHRLAEQEQSELRGKAIRMIRDHSVCSGKAAVVTGHLMLWSEQKGTAVPVYTEDDLKTYTHVIYLSVPAESISRNRLNDNVKIRSLVSIEDLENWQSEEITLLRNLCRQRQILFSLLPVNQTPLKASSRLLCDFGSNMEATNLLIAQAALDRALFSPRSSAESTGSLETVLVFDADRTLAPQDTGTLFWKHASRDLEMAGIDSTLRTLFSGPMGYSHNAFCQAVLLCEELVDDTAFESLCSKVAAEVVIYPELIPLLHEARHAPHVGMVIVTCGVRRIWEIVLQNESENLSGTVEIIGGGRIADGYVISPAAKGALVGRLQQVHHQYVWAFGDSPLDLPMLEKADEAVVVVGKMGHRSKAMESALSERINRCGLSAIQVLLPKTTPPRLDLEKLPEVDLSSREFLDSVIRRRTYDEQVGLLEIFDATDTEAAKLLQTPMRDAKTNGPELRDAHRRVGDYLAVTYLSKAVGLERIPIPHVQGHNTTGFRLRDESTTTIVALMRGGEPMALGVSGVCPRAMFVHASNPEDVTSRHVQEQRTVVLVDSVINSGKTILRFIKRVRHLVSSIRIVVVAGVIQEQFLVSDHLKRSSSLAFPISVIALRRSENKFTGGGNTDTGNRLFNTTHLL